MFKFLLITIVCIFFINNAHADEDIITNKLGYQIPKELVGTKFEDLRIPSGTTVTMENGIRKLHFPNNVTYSEKGVGIDGERGGVLCGWRMSIALKSMFVNCLPPDDELARRVDYTINKYEDYIVSNSLTPVTKSELHDQIEKESE